MTRTILEWVHDLLPESKPRYTMGVGEPDDFFAVVERGIDMFDCVLPTRIARNGSLLTPEGRMNITNARFRDDPAPPVDGCGCYTCQHFSRAYLRHLFKAKELLAYHLATVHNLYFTVNLVKEIRRSIVEGRFASLREGFLTRWQRTARHDSH
jgi:queuine tRNA-ribosyltransferase